MTRYRNSHISFATAKVRKTVVIRKPTHRRLIRQTTHILNRICSWPTMPHKSRQSTRHQQQCIDTFSMVCIHLTAMKKPLRKLYLDTCRKRSHHSAERSSYICMEPKAFHNVYLVLSKKLMHMHAVRDEEIDSFLHRNRSPCVKVSVAKKQNYTAATQCSIGLVVGTHFVSSAHESTVQRVCFAMFIALSGMACRHHPPHSDAIVLLSVLWVCRNTVAFRTGKRDSR